MVIIRIITTEAIMNYKIKNYKIDYTVPLPPTLPQLSLFDTTTHSNNTAKHNTPHITTHSNTVKHNTPHITTHT